MMRTILFLSSLFMLASMGCTPPVSGPLQGFTVVIDPGHGGTAETDDYRVGIAGEREEWMNLRVSRMLAGMLEEAGANVLLTRTEDVYVDLAERARLAVDHQADVFISVHHNATADTSVNFPILYYHGNASQNRASVLLARKVGDALRDALFEGEGPVSVVSDHVIFPTRGAGVLRESYGIPAIISEASFFTHPAEEQRLKQPDYNEREARALFEAISAFLRSERPDRRIIAPYSRLLEPLPVLQEAERMQPEALLWREDVAMARGVVERLQAGQAVDLTERNLALERLYRSVRSFPDSYLAREAHAMRAILYQSLGDDQAAGTARLRITEFFPDDPNRSVPSMTNVSFHTPDGMSLSYMIHLSDGTVIAAHDPERQVPSASVIKTPIFAALLQEAMEGRIDLNAIYTLQESDIVGGTGELQHGGAGQQMTWLQYGQLMIQTSDNVATNVVIRAIGMDTVNELIRQTGLTHTVLAREMMDFQAIEEGRQNYTSAADMNRFLMAMLREELLNPEMRRLFWDTLALCDDDLMLRAGAPAQVTIAHKTGILDYVRGDSGVLFGQQTYIITAFAEEFSDVSRAEAAVATLVSRLY